jgi:hypothetical protein
MEANGLTNGSPIVRCGEFTNEFVINPGTRQGWNYLWNNNQGRGAVCHYFWILCFTKTADQAGKMQCIGFTCSNEFGICSSKRKTAVAVAAGSMKRHKTKPGQPQRAMALPETLEQAEKVVREAESLRGSSVKNAFAFAVSPSAILQEPSFAFSPSILQRHSLTLRQQLRQLQQPLQQPLQQQQPLPVHAKGLQMPRGGKAAERANQKAEHRLQTQDLQVMVAQQQHQLQVQQHQQQHQHCQQQQSTALNLELEHQQGEIDCCTDGDVCEICSVSAAFDKIALERELMKGINDMLAGTAECEGVGKGAGRMAAEGGMTAADVEQETGQSDISSQQFADIDQLFTSMYSPDGTYNQVLAQPSSCPFSFPSLLLTPHICLDLSHRTTSVRAWSCGGASYGSLNERGDHARGSTFKQQFCE